jgi:hypothetical protein
MGERADFHYVPRLGVSIQRMDAKSSWRHSVILEQTIRKLDPEFDIIVTVRWDNQPGAAFPGQSRTWRPLRIADFALD